MSIRSVRLVFVVATLVAISLVGSAQVRIVPSRIPSGSAALFGDGSVSVPSIAFAANTTSGIWRPAANTLAVTLLNSSRVFFQTTALTMPAAMAFGWNSSTDATAISQDTNMTRLAAGSIGFLDGTITNPALAFQSETGLGFWRSAAGTVTLQGALASSGSLRSGGTILVGTGSSLSWGIDNFGSIASPANGVFNLRTNAATIGSQFKADALPTVASGFGTSPSVTAGSTALAGSVNIGTGGTASSGTLNFNGTAFPSAPFCVSTNLLSSVSVRANPTTTQVTFTNASAAAWTASDVVSWICISSK